MAYSLQFDGAKQGIRATISMGDAKNAPMGPQSQVQKANATNTAKAFSDRPRPTIDGVTK